MSLQLALSSFAIFSSPELAVLQAGLLAMIRPISIDKNYILFDLCCSHGLGLSRSLALFIYRYTYIDISIVHGSYQYPLSSIY